VTAGLLDGRVVLVTGAGGGVGEGIARACAAHGAAVVIAARRTETGDPVAAAIEAAGGRALSIRCDVAVRADVDAAVAAAVDTFGGLDCLVHNALSPVGAPTATQDLGEELWGSMMATAVRASFSCAQLGFPHLRERGGSLVLLTSAAGIEGSPYLPAYSVVKAAQRGFAKSLAREWGPLGVRVNCIAPVAMTPAMERTYVANPVLEERLTGRTPMRRIGDPEQDIGGVAVFLASDLSRYVTGQTVVVDGGGFMGL
jgi:NAD(P)-dependent dehydrogenase (short-subunit alcohol dehydrogenase family)